MTDLDTARGLLGQQVRVTISFGRDGEPATIARGKLLACADNGEIIVQDRLGVVFHAWPMLDITGDNEPAPWTDSRLSDETGS